MTGLLRWHRLALVALLPTAVGVIASSCADGTSVTATSSGASGPGGGISVSVGGMGGGGPVVDGDGDGYASDVDCDDGDPDVNPGVDEVCDGIDNDCDGDTDEDDAIDAPTWYEDKDGDGHGISGVSVQACNQPDGFAAVFGDCNDNDEDFYPGAPEADCSDPNDYNCDGSVGYADVDNDGFAACEECDDLDAQSFPGAPELCDGKDNDCNGVADAVGGELDNDGDGSFSCADCDDNDPNNYPGNMEACDGQDNDCNGTADAPGGENDVDGDLSYSCADCDDLDPTNFPGNLEICDGKDNNCNMLADFPGELVNADGDPSLSCNDCDDNNPNNYPGNTEICDGLDNNCSGAPSFPNELVNLDGDPALGCADCNDNNAAIYPGAPEVCDGVDNNCNGFIDQVEVPINVLCPNQPNATTACGGVTGCYLASCAANYYDVNGQYIGGCECLAQPNPVTNGSSCSNPIDLGNFTDAQQTQMNVQGNTPFPGRSIWYVFSAIDDVDTNGDEFHAAVQFLVNPGNAYRMNVYRGGCPGTGTLLGGGAESLISEWYTDFARTNAGCTVSAPCGEGNCQNTASNSWNFCQNNTAAFYVRVYHNANAASCSLYTLRVSNGLL